MQKQLSKNFVLKKTMSFNAWLVNKIYPYSFLFAHWESRECVNWVKFSDLPCICVRYMYILRDLLTLINKIRYAWCLLLENVKKHKTLPFLVLKIINANQKEWLKKIKNDILHILKNFFLFADLPMKVKSLLVINPEIPTFPLDHRQSWLKKFFVVNEFSLGVSQPPHLPRTFFLNFWKFFLSLIVNIHLVNWNGVESITSTERLKKKTDFHSVYHNAAIYYRVKPVFLGIIHLRS